LRIWSASPTPHGRDHEVCGGLTGRCRRRCFGLMIRTGRWLLIGLLTMTLVGATPAFAEPRSAVVGTSQGGAPLVLYELGAGPKRVLIVGGQHGGPEANTVELVNGLLEYFDANLDQVPAGIELDVLPVANPDGLAAGSRQFASGVDPNGNWGGS